MKKLRIRAVARRELEHAAAWYRDRDEGVAERFLSEMRATLDLIEEFPDAGATVAGVDDASIRRLPVRTFPYHIVFLNLPERIVVLAIAHDRRRPGYWSS